MTPLPTTRPFRVAGWLVDPVESTVARAGEIQRLEPKVMAVLVCLFENRDRVVSKEELLATVWPDTRVEEVALARSVSEIRRVFGDDARASRVIRTAPRRGYQWLAAPAPRLGRLARGIAAATAVVSLGAIGYWSTTRPSAPTRPQTIAVLPFIDLSESADSSYFADGMTEDVITRLSLVEDLRVISRTSVMPYRGSEKPLATIASELGATVILEGSIRRDVDRVRIVGQLVDAETDTHLWAETYDRDIEDLFGVQRDVAEAIATALEIRLAPERAAPTADVHAYDLYLRGRSFYERADRPSVEKAIALFQSALQRDPDFPLAHAGLADAHARKARQLRDYGIARIGVAAAERAIALDDELAEAHKALGFAYAAHDLYQRAIPAYERALELRPGYWQAANNLSVTYGSIGALDRAYEWRRHALTLDPARAIPRANFAQLLRALELDDEADAWFHHALELEPFNRGAQEGLSSLDLYAGRNESARERMVQQIDIDPGCRGCWIQLGLIELLMGDATSARRRLERALTLAGDPTVPHLRLAAMAEASGDDAEAARLVAVIEPRVGTAIAEGSEWWGPRWSRTAIASIRGELDEAVAAYEQAYRLGRRDPRWDSMDPLFDNVRRDPRFERVLEKMRADVSSMRARLEDVPIPRRGVRDTEARR